MKLFLLWYLIKLIKMYVYIHNVCLHCEYMLHLFTFYNRGEILLEIIQKIFFSTYF